MGFIIVLFMVSFALIFIGSKSSNGNISKNKEVNNNNNLILENFNPSIIRSVGDYSFLISEAERKIAIRYDGVYRSEAPIQLDIDNISNLEIAQDNKTIISGGIGRAIAGGIIAGGVGAIVGANTAKQEKEVDSIEIKVATNDLNNPLVKLCLYGKEEKIRRRAFKEKYSPDVIYKHLEELIVILNIIKEG